MQDYEKVFLILALVWKQVLATWLFHLFLTILYVCEVHQCSPLKMQLCLERKKLLNCLNILKFYCKMENVITTKILDEREILKTYIIPTIINNKSLCDLEIWKDFYKSRSES